MPDVKHSSGGSGPYSIAIHDENRKPGPWLTIKKGSFT